MIKTAINYIFGAKSTDYTGPGSHGSSVDGTDIQESGSSIIEVHPLTNRATTAWDKMKVKGRNKNQAKVNPIDPGTPISDDKIRFVCLSDTHATIEKRPDFRVPDGDVLIHAGDFTNVGQPHEIKKFNEYLGRLPHKHKVVIAGNHDLTFDKSMDEHLGRWRVKLESVRTFLKTEGVEEVKDLLTNCIYLEDSLVNLYGINIYGSPWQPEFGDWGFNLRRGEPCLEKWNMIPEKTDILITHGPPVGYGDITFDGTRAGCVELLNTIQNRVKPLYHIFGHIHEGYGMFTDGFTTYINASTCTLRYKPDHPPIVFDYPVPVGHSKQETIDVTVKHFGDQQKSDSQKDLQEENDDEVVFRCDEDKSNDSPKAEL